MKLIFTFFLFLFIGSTSFAQKISFTDTSNKWTLYNGWLSGNMPGSYTDYYEHKGDTTINGIAYRNFGFGYVREDTANKLVYIRDLSYGSFGQSIDTGEYILYNYNLHVGDTFSNVYPNDTFIFYVGAIDSTMIDSVWYKVWRMDNTGFLSTVTQSFNIIEGIGSTKGPWFPVYPYEFENRFVLTCFSNDGTIPKPNPKIPYETGGHFDNDTSCYLSVENIANHQKNITVVPNPANENSRMVFPYTIASGSLVIINGIGQVVYSQWLKNITQVHIGNKVPAPGIYYYRVVDDANAAAFSGRFLYQ